MQRRRYLFGGSVQGVGFRYSAQAIASRHPVSGFVRNLSDGRVEMVIEGEDSALDQVIAQLSDHMAHHIQETDVQAGPATGEFHGFSITH